MKNKDKFIFIVDDTGFNKENIESEALKQEKYCFAGIIIHESNIPALEEFMDGLTCELYSRYKTSEFHFTEMYNQKENFKNLSKKEFLSIAECMSELVEHLGCYVIVQSVSDYTYSDTPKLKSGLRDKYLRKMQMKQNFKSDCLILSILKAKRFIEEDLNGELDYVICDEGLRKPDNIVAMPSNVNNEDAIDIKFKSSTDFPSLQLADFVAWSISRQKQIMKKSSAQFTNYDVNLLKAFSSIVKNIQLNNVVELQIDPVISNKVPYDELINLDRQLKGLDEI